MSTLFAALVFFRLLLAFSPVPDYLADNHQLTSPLTSFTRLNEGVFLLKNGFDPYAGQLVRHSPSQLVIFGTFLPPSKPLFHLIWTLVDAFTAWSLSRIWRARNKQQNVRREALIQASYLLNPYLVAPSLALSTSTLDNALCILSVYFASKGRPGNALLTLALLTQSSLYSGLLVFPLSLLLRYGPESRLSKPQAVSDWSKSLRYIAQYAAFMAALALWSTLTMGNLRWIKETWGATLTVADLTPNVGLWWYFFTEMFDHFRNFFLMVFTALTVIGAVPLTLKFQHDPLYAVYLVIGNVAIFKSYQTMADPGLFLSLLSIFPEVWPYLRHPLPTVMWHLYAATLLPLFNNLWLGQGTGNSNFFYAATLVFGVANGAAFLDSVWAGLTVPYGEIKENYSLIQI